MAARDHTRSNGRQRREGGGGGGSRGRSGERSGRARSAESERDERAQAARSDLDLIKATPALVRIAAGAWWRTAEWTVSSSLRAGSRVLRAATSGESAADLLQDAGAELRETVRRLLDITGPEERIPTAESQAPSANGRGPANGEERRDSLRRRGEELLRRSADTDYEEAAHPAYERILGSLAPDEGRILRFLALEGPQPAVDVRAAKSLAPGTDLVAPGLSMIGENAGCRYLDRVHQYLNNLERLGLIWFSRESLEDPLRYQVLEAQPEVLDALRSYRRSKTVRRSIHLTPFGEDFCEVCLPLHTAELEALPSDATDAEEPTDTDRGDPQDDSLLGTDSDAVDEQD
jgi:Abortive infection alpha